MTTDARTNGDARLAATVAPEDLQCGHYVAVLHEIVEVPSFLWCESDLRDRDEVVRLRCWPTDEGTPLKVKAICLPFVFVKPPCGPSRTIDVRQVELVRLQKAYAKAVWKEFRRERADGSRRN